MSAIAINLQPQFALSDEAFRLICRQNPHCKFERTATGELVVVALSDHKLGNWNAKLVARLEAWNEQRDLGVCFDAATSFKLPNSAIRSPAVAWVSRDRWEALTPEEQHGFPPLCPDFLVELKSRSDDLARIQTKMQDYLANGLRLGWLLDPKQAIVEVYRPGQDPERFVAPESLAGESVLPGFVLSLSGIL